MIYWDYNATAPLRKKVRDRVSEVLDRYPGNPSSVHRLGQEARSYIESVRRKLADTLGVLPNEIIFTGSATETNALALRGHWLAQKNKAPSKNKILASRIEHPSVCSNIDFLAEHENCEIVELARQDSGQVDCEKTGKLMQEHGPFLCSLQAASNETGILQPWEKLAALCAENQIAYHSDMVQLFGRCSFDLKEKNLSTATLSFHKSGGIRSSSILYLNKDCSWVPSLVGGGQEKKRWAGTENILSIASIDALFEELPAMIDDYQNRVLAIRDEFETQLIQEIPEVIIVGKDTQRLPNTSFCIFPNIPSDALLMSLDVKDICASAGSACSSGLSLPSSSLKKLGFSENQARSAVRFSLGESSQPDQIPKVIDAIKKTRDKFLAA